MIFCASPQEQSLNVASLTSWQRPIVSICWGHRDSRLLMASGPALYVVRVEHRVSSLQLLCQQAIASALREDKDVSKLTLPPRLCSYLSTAFIPTIKVEPLYPPPAGSPLPEGWPGGQSPRMWARIPGQVCKSRVCSLARVSE